MNFNETLIYMLINVVVFTGISYLFYLSNKKTGLSEDRVVKLSLQGGLVFIMAMNAMLGFVVMWSGVVRDIVSGVK